MDPATLATAAGRLLAAYSSGKPIDPLTTTYEGMDLADAYEIQLLQIRSLVAGGRQVKGHKVGLTSVAMQKQLGVSPR